MSTDPMTIQSDEARRRWREILDHAEHGGEVRIFRYNRPAVVMTSPDPNPLDARLLAMAAILRESGDGDTADEIEVNAAYVREALRGSDDRGIADALEIIASYAVELAKIVRYSRPSAALKADMDARDEEQEA